MKNDLCLFSIIIPLYNKEKNIKNTILSVLSQTFPDFEIIVVDDGSTDDSAKIVNMIDDYRIKYFYKRNGGVSSARNYGIKKSKGEWIFFLDADDILRENALKCFYNVMISCKEQIDIITGNSVIVKNGNEIFHEKSYYGIIPNNYKWFFLDKFVICSGCIAVRKEHLKGKFYDETFSRFEDMEFALRILKGAIVFVIPDIVFEYHCDNNKLSKISENSWKKDYTFYMSFKNRGFWEKCFLGKLLMLAFAGYPNERVRLFKQYKFYVFYAIIAKIRMFVLKIRYLGSKIFSIES